ncbi:uncharacterized protein B0P05DRAFT_579765 [Gilbertella persicaria]|uniref:uncharacterized protein n=1 Tax=Gilbertella persicaria TaxID=101096 RepID=UPI00221F4553|nr:uncharacterized protein B0P05DRAFT_579765 [Gilbertella persicaria]KAI8076646.1 hypothetical protein B0P05DRAFT_579765 [Gilbertella persicaria]
MDIEIFKLSKQADKKRLVEYLDQQSKEEFTQLVCHKLNDYHASNDVDTLLLLRALIQGIQNRNKLSDEERESPEKSKQASLVVNLILPEIESLPTWILRDAARTITHAIQQKKVQLRLLDIFVKIWNILAAAEKVIELSDLFDRLLEAEWHDYLVVGMASALNDMELSNPQLEAVLRYMIKKLPQIEVEEVPPFIYQLLLISRKVIESTVMLHLSFALKQDQDLGNELIKLIKTNKSSQFEVFNMAYPIFDLFKTNIMSVYKDSEKLERCYWISDYSSLEADRFGQVLLEVTERSAVSGWDQVIQSLTQLSLILVDTATSIGSFFQTNTIKTRSQTKEHTSMEKVAHLGTLILLRLFKYHGVVQSEILEQITSRIVSRSSSTLHFLDLLASIIRDYPDTVERYLTNVSAPLFNL